MKSSSEGKIAGCLNTFGGWLVGVLAFESSKRLKHPD
jgi:hypothetical protein